MKQHSNRLVAGISILLLSITLFTGCSTLRAWVQDVPVWVIEKPANTLTKVFFVSEGIDPDGFEMTARQFAYEGLLTEVSEFLGYSTDETYSRELLQTGAITDLELIITEEFIRESEEGLQVYIIAESNRKTISKLVRDNLDTIKADEERIDAPEAEAKDAYKRQEDYQAFLSYIEAAQIAYTSPLAESQARYDGLMRNAISVLEGLNIASEASDPDQGVFTVKVTRGTGIFAPKIEGLPLAASFPIKNAAGKVRQQELQDTTDSKGLLTIAPTHTNFRGSGVVRVYLDLEEVLTSLSESIGADDPYVIELRSLIVKKSIEFEFSISSDIAGSVIVVAFLDYKKNGSLTSDTVTLDSLISSLKADGIFVNRIDPNGELSDEDAMLNYATETYGDSRSIVVIGSAGVTSIIESSGSHVASVKGDARIYALEDGSLFAESGTFAANAVGATPLAAQEAAFQRFGQIAASLIISKLL